MANPMLQPHRPHRRRLARVAVSPPTVHRVADRGLPTAELEGIGCSEKKRVSKELMLWMVDAASKVAKASRLRATGLWFRARAVILVHSALSLLNSTLLHSVFLG